jgi:hypothetical protein
MKEETLMREGIAALMDKLGPVETSRFLAMERPKRKESVRRHRQWQEGLDEEMFLDGLFKTSDK